MATEPERDDVPPRPSSRMPQGSFVYERLVPLLLGLLGLVLIVTLLAVVIGLATGRLSI